MTRSRALGLAAVVLALVWITGYLLRRRSGRASARELPPRELPSPAVTAPPAPAPPAPAQPAPAPPPPPPPPPPPTAAVPPLGPRAEPRSWDSGRIPRTPPRPVPPAADAAEPQLPTWLRVLIVAAALLAFFAISLIATKQV